MSHQHSPTTYQQFSNSHHHPLPTTLLLEPPQQKLTQYRLFKKSRITNQQQYNKTSKSSQALIVKSGSTRQGSIVNYFVVLLGYCMHIVMLNLPGRAPRRQSMNRRGAFGRIRVEEVNGREVVVKRQMFGRAAPASGGESANKREIEQIIIQVAISKLCSFFEIAPHFLTELGFDLLCYSDCTQFHLQLCSAATASTLLQSRQQLQSSLLLMHHLGLIHKDIKPDNIMYSNTMKKCVFIDYGLSHFVWQTQQQRSQTKCQGTLGFMGPELLRMRGKGGQGLVNLYQNDWYSLRRTYEVCEERRREEQREVRSRRGFNGEGQEEGSEEMVEGLVRAMEVQGVRREQIEEVRELNQWEKNQRSENYDFVRLLFRYSNFGRFSLDVKDSWSRLNLAELTQILELVRRTMDPAIIRQALQQIQTLNQNIPFQIVKQLKSLLSSGCLWPQLIDIEQQSQQSIIFKTRIYGHSNELLIACLNFHGNSQHITQLTQKLKTQTQTQTHKPKPKQKQNLHPPTQKPLQPTTPLKLRHKSTLQQAFLTLHYCVFHYSRFQSDSARKEMLRKAIQCVGDLEDSDFKAASLHLLRVCFQYSGKEIESCEDLGRFLHKVDGNLKERRFGHLVWLASREFLKRKQFGSIIRFLKPLVWRIYDGGLEDPALASTIVFSHFILCQYRQALQQIKLVQQLMTKISATQLLFLNTLSPHLFLRTLQIRTQCLLITGSPYAALQSCRHLLQYHLCTHHPQLNTHTIIQDYYTLSRIYKILKLRHLSKLTRKKAQRIVRRAEVVSSRMMIRKELLRLLVWGEEEDEWRFEYCRLKFMVKTGERGQEGAVEAELTDYNLLMAEARGFIENGERQKSINSYFLTLFARVERGWTQPFLEYAQALLNAGEYEFARKVIGSSVNSAGQTPKPQKHYIGLNILLIKARMACGLRNKSLEVANNITLLVSQSSDLLQHFTFEVASILYRYGLVKPALHYANRSLEIVRGLENNHSDLMSRLLLSSKILILKRDYSNALELLEKCEELVSIHTNKDIIEQVYSYLLGVHLVKKSSIQLIKNYLTKLSQVTPSHSPPTLYYFRSSQFYLLPPQRNLKLCSHKAIHCLTNPNFELLDSPILRLLHTGRIFFLQKQFSQALCLFTQSARAAIKIKGVEFPQFAETFVRIGQTLIVMGLISEGTSLCVQACRTFRSCRIVPNQSYGYSTAIRYIRLYGSIALLLIPSSLSLKKYTNLVPHLFSRLTPEQHQKHFRMKIFLHSIFVCSENHLQKTKIEVQILLHLRILGENECANTWEYIVCQSINQLKESQTREQLRKLASWDVRVL